MGAQPPGTVLLRLAHAWTTQADRMPHQPFNAPSNPAGRPRAARAVALAWAVVAISGLLAASLPSSPPDEKAAEPAQAIFGDELVAVARPPFSDDIFPCSGCHAETDVVDRTRRIVDFHETVHFTHDAENRWCLDCHDAQNRDKLKLADGRLLDFTESYILCAQCHGTKFRDWKAGEHGRRTGSWSGTRQYLLCVHCHDPHSPKFKSMEPLPPPLRQEMIR